MMARRYKAMAGAAVLALSLSACGGAGTASDEKSLTVTMWGGQAQSAHVASYFTPWGEANGVTIKQDSPTDYAKIETQVNAGKVNWGVVEVEPNFANTACEKGLLEKLPQRVIDAAKAAGVPDAQMGECAIPNLQYTFSIAYNTKMFADKHPTTWAEFFDTKTFPGKRGFWKYATGGMFEAALLADGVPADQLYPLDLPRAFAKLDTIKKDIVWYDTGDQQTQLVASGEAPLVQAWNGRITKAASEGQAVANDYGQNLISYDQVVIPKGYPNAELAADWMVWFLGNPQAHADDAVASGYGPVSSASIALAPEADRNDLAGSDAVAKESVGLIDYSYWAKNYDSATEELNNWIAK